jgi:hypothetical protein
MDPLTSLVTALAADAAVALLSTVEQQISPFPWKRLRPITCWHHGIGYELSHDPLLRWTLTLPVVHA